MTAKKLRAARTTQEDALAVTGLGAITVAYLRADFDGDEAACVQLVQTYGSTFLLGGVSAALRSSIAESDRTQYLEQLADTIPRPVPAGSAAFVRGQ